MNEQQKMTAKACLAAAYDGTKDFPAIVAALMEAGFEGYAIDYRRGTAVYYLPDGDGVELPTHRDGHKVAADFVTESMREAIREAQDNVPGYTYKGFCRKVKAAGCAGYIVSFSGRRVVYYGRSAETHVEHFPDR